MPEMRFLAAFMAVAFALPVVPAEARERPRQPDRDPHPDIPAGLLRRAQEARRRESPPAALRQNRSLEQLTAAIRRPGKRNRQDASWAASKLMLRGEQGVAALVSFFNSPDLPADHVRHVAGVVHGMLVSGSRLVGDVHAPVAQAMAQHRDAEIQVLGLEALGHVGRPEDAELFMRALREGPFQAFSAAALAVGRLNLKQAAPLLLDALHDEQRSRRSVAAAARALGRIGASEAVKPLARLAGGRDRGLARVAVQALKDLECPDALPVLRVLLNHRDRLIVRTALEALAAQGPQAARRRITALLHHDSSMVREAAVRAVGALDDEQSAAALREVRHDKDLQVRRALISVMRDRGQVDGLCAMRADEQEEIRTAACEALGALGAEGMARLEQWLDAGEPSARVRMAIAGALRDAPGDRPQKAALRLVTDPSEPVRLVALSTIARRRTPDAGSLLLKRLKAYVESDPDAAIGVVEEAALLRALARTGDGRAIPLVAGEASEPANIGAGIAPRPAVQRAAVQALVALGAQNEQNAEDAVLYLCREMQAVDPLVRETARMGITLLVRDPDWLLKADNAGGGERLIDAWLKKKPRLRTGQDLAPTLADWIGGRAPLLWRQQAVNIAADLLVRSCRGGTPEQVWGDMDAQTARKLTAAIVLAGTDVKQPALLRLQALHALTSIARSVNAQLPQDAPHRLRPAALRYAANRLLSAARRHPATARAALAALREVAGPGPTAHGPDAWQAYLAQHAQWFAPSKREQAQKPEAEQPATDKAETRLVLWRGELQLVRTKLYPPAHLAAGSGVSSAMLRQLVEPYGAIVDDAPGDMTDLLVVQDAKAPTLSDQQVMRRTMAGAIDVASLRRIVSRASTGREKGAQRRKLRRADPGPVPGPPSEPSEDEQPVRGFF